MMLRSSFGMVEEANAVEEAVENVLNAGYRTSEFNQSEVKFYQQQK